MKFLDNLFIKIQKFYLSKILKKHYIRTGACKGCGKCCQQIYVRHAKNIINNEEEFEYLKTLHYFYNYLVVVGKDETGLVFECSKLDKTTGKCTAYNTRPLLCRQYPLEEIFMMGGGISEDCGYKFTPINSFEDIFNKLKRQ